MKRLITEKKVIATRLFFITLMVTSVIICQAQFAGGEGTFDEPWEVETAEHLDNIRDYLGAAHNDKHFIQIADIDLGEAPWNEGEGWVPIGSSSANSFRGFYDGGDYVISNLTINRTSGSFHALFGYTVEATIRNLGLLDVDIYGHMYVAGLIGRQDGTSLVQSCFVTGNIDGFNFVGGLVAYMRDAGTYVFDSYSMANITTRSTIATHYGGGLVGYQFNGETRRCYATGVIETLVTSSNVGAVIGNLRAGDYSHLYWNTQTTSMTRGIGNIADSPGQTTLQLMREENFIGYDFEDMWRIDEEISHPYLEWEGEEAGSHNIPPFLPPANLAGVGGDQSVNLTWDAPPDDLGVPDGYNVYRDGVLINDEIITVTEYLDTELTNWLYYTYRVRAVHNGVESLYSSPIDVLAGSFAGGTGTDEAPYHIESAEDLYGIRFFMSSHFRQTADIDLGVPPWDEGEGWEPIGTAAANSFTGYYDGGDYVISNLTMNRPSGNYHALFGYTNNATIINVGLRDVNIYGNQYVAGLIGYQQGASLVQSCYVTGKINGFNFVAGLVSYMRDAETYIYDSYSTAMITTRSTVATHYAGGIVGYQFNGELRRCYAAGLIETEVVSGNVGAVIGNIRDAVAIQSHIYWNNQTTFMTSGIGNIEHQGQTTLQLISQDTYDGFDFEDTWNIDEGMSYPYLAWEGDQAGEHNLRPYLPPTNLSGVGIYHRAELSWDAPADDFGEPDGYNIYRDGERVNEEELVLVTNYEDTGLTNWTDYSYRVKAVHNGEESLPSPELRVFIFGFPEGAGTEDDPYIVETPDQLHGVRYALSAHYLQRADIDLGTAPWNEEEGWEPIGPTLVNSFQGAYDGDNYTISNLTINRMTSNFQGLFGNIVDATIINVGLQDINVVGMNSIAGLVGMKDGNSVVQYCYATGDVSGVNMVAGLVAAVRSADSSVLDCYSTVNIETRSTSPAHFAGGIVAYLLNGETRRCYATGMIELAVETNFAGAVIGSVGQGEYSHIYWNTDTTLMTRGVGNVEDTPGQTTLQLLREETFAGFDFEDVWRIEEDRSHPFLDWEGEEAGYHNLPTLGAPRNLTAVGGNEMVSLNWEAPPDDMGEPDGYNVYRDDVRINEELIEHTHYDDTGLDNWTYYRYRVRTVFQDMESLPSSEVMTVTLGFDEGSGTEEDPYRVENAEHLNGIRYAMDAHYLQTTAIDLGVPPWNENGGWEPIGDYLNRFTGNYDGNFNIISNLYIERELGDAGLFGVIDEGATLRNIPLRNVDINQDGQAGALAVWTFEAEIENCSAIGSIVGSWVVGGLIGRTDGSTVSKCFSKGSVRATGQYVGGLIGRNENGDVDNCYSRASVTGHQRDIGGLISYNNNGDVSNSYSTGRITATHDEPVWHSIGGLIGRMINTEIINSYWDTETSEMDRCAGGQARVTRQMTYPSDLPTTYIDWDFEDIWAKDVTGTVNNGYPIMRYQYVELDTPEVTINIIEIEDEQYIRLEWEAITDAQSYKIFATSYPATPFEEWGDPIDIVAETEFEEAIIASENRFYRVVASTSEVP